MQAMDSWSNQLMQAFFKAVSFDRGRRPVDSGQLTAVCATELSSTTQRSRPPSGGSSSSWRRKR